MGRSDMMSIREKVWKQTIRKIEDCAFNNRNEMREEIDKVFSFIDRHTEKPEAPFLDGWYRKKVLELMKGYVTPNEAQFQPLEDIYNDRI